MIRLILLVAAGALAAASALHAQEGPVLSGVPCSSYQAIARALGEEYREVPVSAGLQTDGRVLQVFSSPQGDTWTILSTSPDGISCVIAAGKRWESGRPPLTDPGA
jgi:hypothetical protein